MIQASTWDAGTYHNLRRAKKALAQVHRLARVFSARIHTVWMRMKRQIKVKNYSPSG